MAEHSALTRSMQVRLLLPLPITMMQTHRDPITGKVYHVYDDEPPDRDDPEDDEDKEDSEDVFEEAPSHYERELERYYRWLYGE